ncbi:MULTISPECIES: hypothetical protein [Planktothricoides]|uniref:PIN domain-containing protein n=2 Tax=Planktothricoides raciborskii TaxID=132608 RepID=A0AAU8JN24_9CYAN|nr:MULTISPECIES: hypothetical protein [Planktothricoides]KOR37770.1 hypothetical protein AM228_04670 [Planktothricoides sp. SR001]MBD2543522.1 hypothetical protein [Planktothricoides raciborskii FACHB-1370]MBD2581213.1 hypothetical protein [Planktothricoides raciborskii FACHB-1261]
MVYLLDNTAIFYWVNYKIQHILECIDHIQDYTQNGKDSLINESLVMEFCVAGKQWLNPHSDSQMI